MLSDIKLNHQLKEAIMTHQQIKDVIKDQKQKLKEQERALKQSQSVFKKHLKQHGGK